MLDVSILQGTFAFFKLYELLVGLNISVSNEKSRTSIFGCVMMSITTISWLILYYVNNYPVRKLSVAI